MVDSSTLAPQTYIEGLLSRLLGQVHPRLRTTFYQLSVPYWFHQDLVAALAGTDRATAEGILQRVAVYSMVSALPADGTGDQAYAINSSERDSLQRLAISEAPDLYLAAHLAALDYWQNEPGQNGFVQERMLMYHALFVDPDAGLDLLTRAYTGYVDDGQLAFADQLLATAEDAYPYLDLLGQDKSFLRQLKGRINLMYARSAAERRDWDECLGIVNAIEERLPAELQTYVSALRGLVAAGDRREGPPRFGQAIDHFQDALDQMAARPTGTLTEAALRSETYLAMGDSYVALAELARGYQPSPAYRKGVFAYLQLIYYLITNLPLVIYLGTILGSRVWRPAFWPTLANLDWVVARLFIAGGAAYRHIIKNSAGTDSGYKFRAQERLATLILKLGDAAEADRLLSELLAHVDEAETADRPYSEYQEARLRLTRGQARLWLRQPAVAFSEAQRAYPVFRTYEDIRRMAEAQELAGDAVLDRPDADVIEAGQRYRGALELYVWVRDGIAASAVDAKLWRLPAGVVTGKPYPAFRERFYPVPYRHILTALFQQLTVVILLSLAFILPILTIHLDNQQTLVPDIDFKVSPLLQPDRNFVPQLSQGVTDVLLESMAEPSLLIWLTFLLLGAYIGLSSLLGFSLLQRTYPTKIQLSSDRDLVRLGKDYLSVGVGQDSRTIQLADVQRFIRSDVRVATEVNVDSSVTILETADSAIDIQGLTAHYDVLQERLGTLVPAEATSVNADYNVLRSKMGVLLQLSLVWITLLAGLAFFFPAALGFRLPLLGYSLADLQPLFFLTLFIPPVWWFIIQPLRLQRIRRHGNVLPYIVALGGIGLACFLLITRFKLSLTVPDIYPLLTSIIMCLTATYTLWRFRVSRESFDWAAILNFRLTRAAVGIVAIIFALLMASYLVREMGVYHLKIQANASRDQAVAQGDVAADSETMLSGSQKAELSQAVHNYSRAISWASQPILGIQSPQLVSDLYVNRAIARMSIGTELESDSGSLTPTLEVDNSQYEAALADFQLAIDLEPDRAEYYLWRGFAQHSLGQANYAAAQADYQAALASGGLDAEQRVKAYTGIGWIAFSEQNYQAARDAFQEAVNIADGPEGRAPESSGGPDQGGVSADARSDALLGLGYSYYELEDYDGARDVWEDALSADESQPLVLVSLGTLHWRIGTIDESGERVDLCRTTRADIGAEQKLAAAADLRSAINYLAQATTVGDQDPAGLAFTFRTMAQVEFLLSACPEEDQLALLEAAIASYSAALLHDPDNAVYFQMRGRLQYAAWRATPAGTGAFARVRLFDGIDDLHVALGLRSEDEGGYQPNVWLAILSDEAINGSLQQGHRRLAAGDYRAALEYFALVADRVPTNSEAAFAAGLASLYLDDAVGATSWYETGIARAKLAPEGNVQLENALKALSEATVATSLRSLQKDLTVMLREALNG